MLSYTGRKGILRMGLDKGLKRTYCFLQEGGNMQKQENPKCKKSFRPAQPDFASGAEKLPGTSFPSSIDMFGLVAVVMLISLSDRICCSILSSKGQRRVQEN
jgi:hypothetical protein